MLSKLFIPSFKNLLLFIVFTFFIFQKIYDADLWWHLKTGELIWNTHAIPRFDVFSYTNFGQPWIAHEWLSELFFYVIYKFGGGFAGLVVWQALMVTTILYVLDKIMVSRGVRIPYRLLGLMLTISGTIVLWLTRPHLWTWLLLVVLVWILESKKRLWLIPFLFLFWVNLHTGYVVGLVILAIYIFCYLKEYGEDYGAGAIALVNKAERRWLISIGYLTLLACLFNPNGINIFLFPLTFATGQLPNYKYVQEWAPPALKLVPVFFAVLVGFVFLNACGRRDDFSTNDYRARKFIDNLCLGFFLILALTAVRHVALFMLVMIPYFGRLVQNWVADCLDICDRRDAINWVQDRLSNLQQIDNLFSGWVTIAIMTVVVCFALFVGRISVQIAEENFPVKTVQYIKEQNLRGNMFHHYNWGGYLIWNLWPEQKVFIDGRNEVHGLKFLEDEYLELINLGPKWQGVLEKYDIRYVLLPQKEPLVQMLKSSVAWKSVYGDENNILLARSNNPKQF